MKGILGVKTVAHVGVMSYRGHTWAFPKIRDILFGGSPLYWGPLIYGNYHMDDKGLGVILGLYKGFYRGYKGRVERKR